MAAPKRRKGRGALRRGGPVGRPAGYFLVIFRVKSLAVAFPFSGVATIFTLWSLSGLASSSTLISIEVSGWSGLTSLGSKVIVTCLGRVLSSIVKVMLPL